MPTRFSRSKILRATPQLYREVLTGSAVGAQVGLTTAGNTQIGDQLVCIRMVDETTSSTALTAPTGTAGTWHQRGYDVPDVFTGPRIRVWLRNVTTGGAQSVNCASVGGGLVNHVILYVIPNGRSVNDVRTDYWMTNEPTSTTRRSPNAVALDDALLITCGVDQDTATITGYDGLAQDVQTTTGGSTIWSGSRRIARQHYPSINVTKNTGGAACTTATIVCSLGNTTFFDLQPMQPGGNCWDPNQPEIANTALYAQPGSWITVGRDHTVGLSYFQQVSAAGGTVALYLDPCIDATFGRYHEKLHLSSEFGPATEIWPGQTQSTGWGFLVDFAPGSIVQTKLRGVLELMIAENPHIGAFFIDDLASRSDFPAVGWSSFTLAKKEDYYYGAVELAKTVRAVCDEHNMLFFGNGGWEGGTIATTGGGYPDISMDGNSLLDGGIVENHDDLVGDGDYLFWRDYCNAPQWATESKITRGQRVMVNMGPNPDENDEWAATNAFAYRVIRGIDTFDGPPVPWGSFHATGLPHQAG